MSLGSCRSAVWLGAAWQAASKHAAEALAMVNCALVGVIDDSSEAWHVAGISVRPLAEAEKDAFSETEDGNGDDKRG